MQKNDKQQGCLIFLHIPKNAGSSTHVIFNKIYPEASNYNVFGSQNDVGEIKQFIEKK